MKYNSYISDHDNDNDNDNNNDNDDNDHTTTTTTTTNNNNFSSEAGLGLGSNALVPPETRLEQAAGGVSRGAKEGVLWIPFEDHPLRLERYREG